MAAKKAAAKKTGAKAKAAAPTKRMSGLDAAAKVLAESGRAMNCQEIMAAIEEQKLWGTNGKTPSATLYSAIIREISKKGDASRFRKTDRGTFEANAT